AIRRPCDSFFVARQSAAKVSDHKLKLRIALQDAAGDQSSHRHAEIEFAGEDDRELIVLQQIVSFGRQGRMDEDWNLQSCHNIVKGPERRRVQRQAARLRRDRYAVELEIANRSLQLFQRGLALKRGNVGQADEATRILLLNLRRAVIEQPAEIGRA